MNVVMGDSELEISSNDADDSEIDEGSRIVIRQLVMKSIGKQSRLASILHSPFKMFSVVQ